MKIAAVIPAYNEENSIAGVVAEINAISKKCGIEIIAVVVNDCSKDRTAEIIDVVDCVALHLPVNLGIGGAVQTGFKYAFDNDFDFAVQVDGDGQHPAEFIPLLSDHLKKNSLDVVIGSRYLDKKGFQSSMIRRTGIKYFKWLNKLFTGIEIHDSTSGFRMMNRRALEIVYEYYPDEYPEPEAIILFSKRGLKIGEVAVEMRERQGGVSSINSFSAVYYMFKVSLAIFFTFMRTSKN
ncbi:MAG: glycosyltransferase family 2 protein [Bacteroidia bacterium]|nr:glycosyltransferase family 2 protein [Bacteroidia bacterium]